MPVVTREWSARSARAVRHVSSRRTAVTPNDSPSANSYRIRFASSVTARRPRAHESTSRRLRPSHAAGGAPPRAVLAGQGTEARRPRTFSGSAGTRGGIGDSCNRTDRAPLEKPGGKACPIECSSLLAPSASAVRARLHTGIGFARMPRRAGRGWPDMAIISRFIGWDARDYRGFRTPARTNVTPRGPALRRRARGRTPEREPAVACRVTGRV